MSTAHEIVELIKTEKLSPTQVLKETLRTIKEKDGDINAFLEIFEKSAMQQAENLEEKISKKAVLGKLAGVPIAIKDNILKNSSNKLLDEEDLDFEINDDTNIIVCARLGADDEVIKFGKIKDLINFDFGKPVHCIIIPSKLHFAEEDFLHQFEI